MQFVPSLLFGISVSLDALLVGITFGIRGARIRIWQNLLISTITLLGTCLSVGLGAQLAILLPASLWKLMGSLILILFGFFYILKFMIQLLEKYRLKNSSDEQRTLDTHSAEAPCALTFREACALGCALSANNIGIGLSASIAGLSLLPAATVTMFFSALFLFLGNKLAHCPRLQLTEHAANFISGLLLICLGILSIF